MKNLFEISDDERKRILNLHETATKKQYIIKEQEESQSDILKVPFSTKTINNTQFNFEGRWDEHSNEFFFDFGDGVFERIPNISGDENIVLDQNVVNKAKMMTNEILQAESDDSPRTDFLIPQKNSTTYGWFQIIEEHEKKPFVQRIFSKEKEKPVTYRRGKFYDLHI